MEVPGQVRPPSGLWSSSKAGAAHRWCAAPVCVADVLRRGVGAFLPARRSRWACAQAFGWTRIRGAWYYLDPSTGVVHKGWLKDGDHWYYLTRSGAMVTGARWIDGTRYVFDAQGRLQE